MTMGGKDGVIAILVLDLIIVLLDERVTVFSLQPAEGKMAAGDVLEMLDKHVVDEGATCGSDQRNHFGGGFFRDDDTEPAADRADQLYQGRWFRHTALAQLRLG